MLTEEKVEKFKKVVESLSGDINIIQTQVDPDAIADCTGIKTIIEQIKKKSKSKISIYYCGDIAHRQNKMIFEIANLKTHMKPISELNPEKISNIILVDSSSVKDGRIPDSFDVNSLPRPVIIIDHHSSTEEEEENEFYWIDQEAGASSTQIVELAIALGIDLTKSSIENTPSLLAVGIYTDTKSLVNASMRDRKAWDYLMEFVEMEKFRPMVNVKLPRSYLKNFGHAIDNVDEYQGTLTTGLGVVSSEDGDDISSISDELIKYDGVSLAIVWGIINNEARVSARKSAALSKTLQEILQESIGETSGSKGSEELAEGGGRMKFDLGDIRPLIDLNKTVQEKFEEFWKEAMNAVFLKKPVEKK